MIKLIKFLKKNQIGAITLAELLTSLAILSIVISAVYGFLIQGIDIFKYSEAQTAVQRQARIAFIQLTKDIKGGYSVTVDDYTLEIWGMSVSGGAMENAGGNTYRPTQPSHRSWISEPVVYVNGNPRSDSTYTLNYAQGSITFTSSPPAPGETVTADYTYSVTIEYRLDYVTPPPNQHNEANLVREVTDFNGNSTTNILVRHIRNRNTTGSYPGTPQVLFDDVSPTRIQVTLVIDEDPDNSPRPYETSTQVAFKGSASAGGGDTWTTTSTTDAPLGRMEHTAVWTGNTGNPATSNKMIVWGGAGAGAGNTGGIYAPPTDSWRAGGTSTTDAPSERRGHTAVWTGNTGNPATSNKMIVWGGWLDFGPYYNTGGIYDPATDSWDQSKTNLLNGIGAPSERAYHTAIWTGSKMIVWGGAKGATYYDTGGIYNPETDTWTPISTTNVPLKRAYHTAIWTGSKMIVWGGQSGFTLLNTGGIYDPSDGPNGSWRAGGTSLTNSPSARTYHTAIWTGSQMIIWGGWVPSWTNTGGIYDPSDGPNGSWRTGGTSTTAAPSARYRHTAVWTGSRMIVWAGEGGSGSTNTGGIYDPSDGSNGSWRTGGTSTIDAPSARSYHTAVWTGSQMIVWGGAGAGAGNTGGIYDPL